MGSLLAKLLAKLASIEHGDGRAVVQLGKGLLLEVLKSSTSCRTTPRRSNRRSKGCSSSRSPFHSHGISFSSAMLRSCCPGNISIRCSQGATSSHDSILPIDIMEDVHAP